MYGPRRLARLDAGSFGLLLNRIADLPWLLVTLSNGDPVPVGPVRTTLLRRVEEEPGSTVGDLRRGLGLGWGAFYHHLNRLAALGLVETVVRGRRCLVYPAGHPAARESQARSLLAGPTVRVLARTIVEAPRSSVQDLVERHGLSSRTVYYHVRRLVEAGLVVCPAGPRIRDLTATPRLVALLDALDEPAAQS